MSPQGLQGLTTALFSVVGAVIVLRLAKRQYLTFRYAAGWLTLFLLTSLSGVLLPLATPVAKRLSTTPGVLVAGFAILILVSICIQLSISISGLQKQVQTLAEINALMEQGGKVDRSTPKESGDS